MYVVARGVDNNENPNENDGKLHELSAPLPRRERGPVADAGPDRTGTMPDSRGPGRLRLR